MNERDSGANHFGPPENPYAPPTAVTAGVLSESDVRLRAVTRRLRIRAELDAGKYPTGIKVADQELATVHLKRSPSHGDWNYRILPDRRKKQSTYFDAGP